MADLNKINAVIKAFFEESKGIKKVQAKSLMPQFIKTGIFISDQKEGLPIRKILRGLDKKNQLFLIPFVFAERKSKNTNWFFINTYQSNVINPPHIVDKQPNTINLKPSPNSRTNSDEYYVIDLCDQVLKLKGKRQYRFDFLLGDPNKKGVQAKLPVDVYYPTLNCVIEYKEYQHSIPVKHFDKPDVMTVSGVQRGEQRKIYDQRRLEILPLNGIKVIEIPFHIFICDKRNKITRNQENDLKIVEEYLTNLI